MIKNPQLMQFSFVVADLDAAIKHWAEKMHVGPFFVVEHVEYEACRFQGELTDIDMSVAIAYQGDIQIELVKQHNDAPSIFKQFAEQQGAGLQHVAAVSIDLDNDLREYQKRGMRPVQEGAAANGTRFAYLDEPLNPVPGSMLELVQLPDDVASAFEYMRRAAENWDPHTDAIKR